jgi:DNA-binding GntR family transcriptional regulator
MHQTPVYRALRDLIVRGRLPPGARLAEGALAESLGVSRTPVREAMQRLRHERLLVSVGRGAGVRDRLAVAPMMAAEMVELFGIAAALEGLAGRKLALRPPHERSTLAWQLTETDRAFYNEGMRPTPDYDQLFDLHASFHRQTIEGSAGLETQALLADIRPQLDRYGRLDTFMNERQMEASRLEHGAIAQAIRSGSANDIEESIRTNWLNSAERLASNLKTKSPANAWRGFLSFASAVVT